MLATQSVCAKAKALANVYYGEILSKNKIAYSPLDDRVIATANTIDYLFDCGFSFNEILEELYRHNEESITYSNLSDKLWKGSLIKRDAFYLHRSLRLVSPAPSYNIESDEEISYPFYCEMKIRFTETDVLNFFKERLTETGRILQDDRADLAVLRNMMVKFSRIDYVEPLDLVLCAIENKLNKTPETYRLIQVTNECEFLLNEIIRDMKELESKDLRKMVMRRKCLT